MGDVFGPACRKMRLSRLSEGTPSDGPLILMAPAALQKLGKNVAALGHGEEVCAIMSEAGSFLMSACCGSLIIHRIPDEKGQLQGTVAANVSKFIFTDF